MRSFSEVIREDTDKRKPYRLVVVAERRMVKKTKKNSDKPVVKKPSSTSSKILVGAEGAGSVICDSNGIMQAQIYRGGVTDTAIARFYSGLGSTTSGHEHYITARCLVIDSPSTTSAQTYTFSAQKGSGGTTSARLMAGSDFPITMFAMEIGA